MSHNITDALINEFQFSKFSNRVKHFFKSVNVSTLSRKSNIKKESGQSSMKILYHIFLTPFFNESLTGLWKNGFIPSEFQGSGKDTYYRFLANHKFNWRKFINLLAINAISLLDKFSLWHERVLILDDSTLPKRGRRIELVSWVFDSVSKKSTLGFKKLVLGWSDGFSFIPFDFSLHVSSNRPNEYIKHLDKRTIGSKRRKEALMKKPELALDMIRKAKIAGLDASYVLFDSWFAFPKFIKDVFDSGYDVVCKLKNMPNIRFSYKGRQYNLDALYRKFAKNNLKPLSHLPGKYSALNIQTKEGLAAKIVFYFDNKSKSWSAFLCTDLEATPEKVLKTYAKRWAIEPFFKECKQNLYLGKERCRNFDSIFASAAISIFRYIFVSITTRFESDPKTLGELFKTVQLDMHKLSTSKIVLEIISDETNRMSRALNLSEETISHMSIIMDSISSFLSSMLKFDHTLECET